MKVIVEYKTTLKPPEDRLKTHLQTYNHLGENINLLFSILLKKQTIKQHKPLA